MPTSETIIQTSGLVAVYGDRRVLDGIDLEVGRGERVAVLGPNGAGKTTMLEIIAGFRRQSAGSVRVLNSEPLKGDEAWRASVSMVLQHWADHKQWRARDLLHYVQEAMRHARRPVLDVESVLAHTGVDKLMDKRLGRMSGGERRRVDIAAALLGSPELLILDEPTVGLDPSMRRSFHKMAAELPHSPTILWATHDLDEAEATCGRILLVAAGAIVADGTPSQLRTRYTTTTSVRWVEEGGEVREEHTEYPEPLIVALAGRPGVTGLEVSRGSLEDVYMSIVSSYEMSVERLERV